MGRKNKNTKSYETENVLIKAIKISKYCKIDAMRDPDFLDYREDVDFKKLVT